MFQKLVSNTRSYRRFDEEHHISHEDLKDLIRLARLSPSAANLQVLRFALIHEAQDREAIFPHLKWAGYLRYWDGPTLGERPAAYIIILTPVISTRYHLIDTGIAAQSIVLGATDKGLGACMIASVDKDHVHRIFDLPSDMEISLVIAIGKPSETIVIDDVVDPDDIEYWRDDDGIHHVPKRSLDELIVPVRTN
ncbi:MAG: nitroreductase family protein [Candidatus Cloacimonadaceae bacterium]|nr:nitroreductase family protein [Actinomycetota bacterium]MDZ4182637.1 nitroreductase family protein [Candidatus Cloacimonadaceae bacterium]